MTPPQALLDTDVLSAVMRNHPVAVARAQAYLAAHHHLTFSIITRYEVLRGLKAKGATAQLAAFDRLCAASQIISLTDEIVVRAADIYADLHQRGMLIGDADILIAASALAHGFGIVTNNERHFSRIADLRIENWLKA
jgi:tRNA(fMet)-specific endonuclease VapC